jgi:CubicO group peptidase (beta-lactamase class C family)
MTSDPIFWIASMTKAITSTAAMLLVEQGRLGLDDPIRKVLPELAERQVNTEAVPGGRSANSMAWAGLFNTYYWIDPAKQVADIIMTQILSFLDSTVLRLFDKFAKAIYAVLD